MSTTDTHRDTVTRLVETAIDETAPDVRYELVVRKAYAPGVILAYLYEGRDDPVAYVTITVEATPSAEAGAA